MFPPIGTGNPRLLLRQGQPLLGAQSPHVQSEPIVSLQTIAGQLLELRGSIQNLSSIVTSLQVGHHNLSDRFDHLEMDMHNEARTEHREEYDIGTDTPRGEPVTLAEVCKIREFGTRQLAPPSGPL